MMTMVAGAVLGVAWVGCAVLTFVAALRVRHDPAAGRLGRRALGVLYLVLGAGVNGGFLALGADYGGFADLSPVPFVRDTWRSVVAPHQWFWIGLLVAFEATVGILVLAGGRRTQLALLAMIGFHAGLLTFGWGYWAWAIPMLIALGLLLQAELRQLPLRPEPAPRRPPTRAATHGATGV